MSRQPYLHNLASLKLALDIQQTMKRSKALIDEARHLMIIAQKNSMVPCVTIRRDYALHSWICANTGAHPIKLPWSDETPADSVVRYLKTKANGQLNVRVDLS